MKKIAILLIILGITFIFTGGYLFYFSKEDKKDSIKLSFMDEVTLEDKKLVNDYLSRKYSTKFDIIKHVTTYCFNQDVEMDSYSIDKKCENGNIRNDIYMVSDGNDVTFYVKKVDYPYEIDIANSLKKYVSSSFYDNYISYNVANRLSEQIKPIFSVFEKVENIVIYEGLEIELPDYEMNNDKYSSYIIYPYMKQELNSITNINISIDEYLKAIRKLGQDSNINIHLSINDKLSSDNIKEIIKLIHDNNLNNFVYGVHANKIIIEYNNNLYLEYSYGNNIKILKTDDNLYDDKYIFAYPKSISFDYASSSDSIYYLDFFNLDKIDFVL